MLEVIGQLARQVFAAITDDSVGWTQEQLHQQALATQVAMNSLGATQADRIARFSKDADGEPREFAPDDLAPSMCWGPRQAENKVMDAIAAVDKTPRLLAAAGRGDLDPWRIGLVTNELLNASWQTCQKVEDDLLSAGIERWTGGRTRNRARAAVRRHEPAAERKAAKKRARDEIDVRCRPGHEDGTTEWHATLWSEDARRACAAVEQLARTMHRSNTTGKTLGQCRADAMCDLILGNATVTTHATLLIPVHTGDRQHGRAGAATASAAPRDCGPFGGDSSTDAADNSHAPASAATKEGRTSRERLDAIAERWLAGDDEAVGDVEIPGIGIISKATVVGILNDLGTTLASAVVDQATGALLGTSSTAYRPSAGIRRQVELRDMHCRFPGCMKPARWCDADHVIRWPDGPTDVTNLQLLCRRHHRVKHETAWRVTMDSDGTCHWVSGSGQVFTTEPGLADVIDDLPVTSDAA